MGIVKAGIRRPGIDNFVHRSSPTSTANELEQERLLQGKDDADDSDGDCELAEVGCEIVKVGDQICNVPYDIYDMPDLKEVLSLETWNSCLTEEERFSLSAYLPDMDQQTFLLTMNELLRGEDVFFGSPLEKLFLRLKGGFYSLKVTRFREDLQFFQRRGYYHSLRSYHENMAQTFMDMKKAWINCQSSIDVEEKIRIWNKRKDPKPVYVVDLNAFPADEEVLTKGDKKVATIPLSKKVKCTDNRGATTHVSPTVFNGVPLSIPKMKPKGVLKIKPIKKNSEPTGIVQVLPSDSWGAVRPTPKGVLKIKPRHEPQGQLEKPRALPILSELTSVEASCLRSFRLSPSCQSTCKWDMENFCEESLFPHQEVRDGNTRGSSELLPLKKNLQRGEFVNRCSGPFNNFQSSERKMKLEKGVRFHKIAGLEAQSLPMKNSQKMGIYSLDKVGDRNSENFWQNSGPWNMGLCSNSTESRPSATGHCQGKRQATPLISGAVSRVSSVAIEDYEMLGKSFNQLDYRHRDISGKGLLKLSDQSTVSGAVQEGLKLPITYKRKKAYTKRNSLESVQESIAKPIFESKRANGTDCHMVERAKSVKIRLKI